MGQKKAGEPRAQGRSAPGRNGPRYPAAAGSEPEALGPAPVRSVFLVWFFIGFLLTLLPP